MDKQLAAIELLEGRIRKWTLPALALPLPGSAPRLKRLKLPQGELAHIYDGPNGIQYIAFLELLGNGVRGNHFHRHKQEYIYLSSGEVEFYVVLPGIEPREQFLLRAGELAFIDCGVAHAFKTVQPGHAIEFSAARFDAVDTYPFAVM